MINDVLTPSILFSTLLSSILTYDLSITTFFSMSYDIFNSLDKNLDVGLYSGEKINKIAKICEERKNSEKDSGILFVG